MLKLLVGVCVCKIWVCLVIQYHFWHLHWSDSRGAFGGAQRRSLGPFVGGRGQRDGAPHLSSDHPVHHHHRSGCPHDQHHHMGIQGDIYVRA